MALRIHHPTGEIDGSVELPTSKSISNRLLILSALADRPLRLQKLSAADDTRVLQKLLQQDEGVFNAGEGGTTARFLLAYLSLQPGRQILTGSVRLRQRPIGPLADALASLGVSIRYLEKPGFLPVEVGAAAHWAEKVTIRADISSQFISALLMIAPKLPHGLEVELQGPIQSRPYLEMTLSLMEKLGVKTHWTNQRITIPAGQSYQGGIPFTVESDWSAAGYFFSLAALAKSARIRLPDLELESLQGDAIIADIFRPLGISCHFQPRQHSLIVQKVPGARVTQIRRDFSPCPDLVQTVLVACAGLGIQAHLTGVDSLKIKETDRIKALRLELQKLGVSFYPMPSFGQTTIPQNNYGQVYCMEGKAQWKSDTRIATYGDHRMAMSFAPLSVNHPLEIDHEQVVTKSFPGFWETLRGLGFEIQEV